MSQLPRLAVLRGFPRWSRSPIPADWQTVVLPAPIAGLPAPSAIVCVGPPLLPRGPSSGSAVMEAAKKQVESPNSRLLPKSLRNPLQLPALFPETIELEV